MPKKKCNNGSILLACFGMSISNFRFSLFLSLISVYMQKNHSEMLIHSRDTDDENCLVENIFGNNLRTRFFPGM